MRRLEDLSLQLTKDTGNYTTVTANQFRYGYYRVKVQQIVKNEWHDVSFIYNDKTDGNHDCTLFTNLYNEILKHI